MKVEQRGQPESNLPGGLAAPARRALAGAGIERLEQLTGISEAEIKGLHGIGPNAIKQLRQALDAKGLSFADPKSKKQSLEMLEGVLHRWEESLAGLSEEQITEPHFPSNWSIKDVVAHLWGWQQRSVARVEAFLQNREPDYPRWPERLNPDIEEDVDQTNAWIYETSRDKPWARVYVDWRAQFLRFIELVVKVPEKDLLAPARYAWMEGYPLSETLLGTYEHHEEHLDELAAWLREDGGKKV